MIKLTREQVVLLHAQLIRETGGSDGIRDEGLLDSALHAPFQSYAGTDSFPSIQQKAARLGFGLVKNHAFVDGNLWKAFDKCPYGNQNIIESISH